MKKFFVFLFLTGIFCSSFFLSKAKFENKVPQFEKISPKEEKTDQEKSKEIAPPFEFISPKEGGKINQEIKIIGKVENANSVEFYYQVPQGQFPVYLGSAQQKGKDLWEYSWDTKSTPNGEYLLFVKISNPHGEYQSQKIKVLVENEIPKETEREKALKEEQKKTASEIEEIEGKIKEGKEAFKDEILAAGAKEEIKEKVEEFVQSLEMITKAKKEIEGAQAEKEKKKEIIGALEKEIEKIEKVPEVKAKIIEREKKARIEEEKKDFKEIEEKIKSLEENLEKKEKEKEKIKNEILEKIPSEKKEEISKKIDFFEREIKEKERAKIEKEILLAKDSDGDELSDEFELPIGTDPLNPDSDGDGFLDGFEYKLGYDPKKAGAADKVLFSDAKKAKPKMAEIYKVERVIKIVLPDRRPALKIEGKGLPNSFVTVYIYSLPIVMVTKVDGNGNWSLVLDKPLPDGLHEVYATVTANHGEIVAKSEPYLFEKSGERIVAITLSGITKAQLISPVEFYQKSYLLLTLALISLAIAVAFFIIGFYSQRRIKKES